MLLLELPRSALTSLLMSHHAVARTSSLMSDHPAARNGGRGALERDMWMGMASPRWGRHRGMIAVVSVTSKRRSEVMLMLLLPVA